MKRKIIVTALLMLAAWLPLSAEAQSRWQQTVQALVPVRSGEITGALLDSLIEVVSRHDLMVRLSPEEEQQLSLAELEDRLLDEGLDITSANQVFITYRYEADQRRFQSSILEMYFIYRPEEYEDTDIPIALIDATEPVIKNMLVSNGTTLASNEAVFEPFWDQLRLHQLEEGTVVQVGDRILREEEEAAHEKDRLLGIIRRFLY